MLYKLATLVVVTTIVRCAILPIRSQADLKDPVVEMSVENKDVVIIRVDRHTGRLTRERGRTAGADQCACGR